MLDEEIIKKHKLLRKRIKDLKGNSHSYNTKHTRVTNIQLHKTNIKIGQRREEREEGEEGEERKERR